MARPFKWTPEKLKDLADQMLAYFDDFFNNFQESPTNKGLPFISQFAKEAGLSQETLVSRANELNEQGEPKYPELFGALKRAKEIQKQILILGGLQGRFNATFAIFTAKNITDMRDVSQQEITGKNGGPIETKTGVDFFDPAIRKVVAEAEEKLRGELTKRKPSTHKG